MVGFLREVGNELRQVSWATPRELWESTKVVLVTTALLALVVGTFDFLVAQLIGWILR